MYTLTATYKNNQKTHTLESTRKGESLNSLVNAITLLKADLNQHLTTVIHDSNENNEIPVDEDHVEDEEEEEEEDESMGGANSLVAEEDKVPISKKQKLSP
ncbi:hypothetical protein BJ944DRAFT_249273 [Cunninghamella echinulata]|nr:hypothetical protein BJ944DRAFT_249273 [Cunninghamella echinulata]